MLDSRALVVLSLIAGVTAPPGAMAACPSAQAVAAPVQSDAQHRQLRIFAGEWAVKQSLWLKPGQPPQLDLGRASFGWVLNGRHLRQAIHINSATAFDGLSYFGYDDSAAKYFVTWMDVNFNGIIVAQGAYDSVHCVYTLLGSMNASHGQVVPVREVVSMLDDNHFTYEFFETREGKEVLGVRLDYARVPG